ncbi:class I SAM-dependent methyltransferase [Hydrogenophilus thiooxidans]|uniref:class I SAM-dependent methyltransferase n=1 Tax=Hydrogenophilus thiooxidans TaxID=2820326 RepID=UPI001C22745A|nr:class I SAM-dependent methyltransferase [Hydrogenophilus thiooxidans]
MPFSLLALPPLAKALIAQLGGWLFAYVSARLGTLGESGLSSAGIITIQAVCAAALAWWLASDRWWIPIHLAFTPAIIAAQQLAIAPYWYLVAFVASWLIFRNTIRTRVPLYLSNAQAVEAIAEQLPSDRPFRFLDLGSGTGALLLPLARRFPNGTFVGIESAPLPLWLARWQAQGQSNLVYLSGDIFSESWRGYDFVYAFLSPAPMARVARKARNELAPGAVLISNSFPLPDQEPSRVQPLDAAGRRTLYWYPF